MDNYICPENKCNLKLAYSYVPIQKIGSVYSNTEALRNGTLFPELNLPLGVYGVFTKKGVLEDGE
ncbi:MAG: spore coat associated protein CotJA [Clostridia bacterium]|nr:spore coat associated protein CotJA [Clostridia bacterium]